jgi:sodium/bile acid cotransporter 7
VGAALRPMLPFFIGLGLTLGLAWVAPEAGAQGGLLRTEVTTMWAVALIFFIQGLQLPVAEVRRGLGAWRVHVFCQAWMFVVYPLLGLALVAALGGRLSDGERIGLLFLSVLPTTIATNAAFSSRAGGNAATALFNIVAGNFLGVFIAPAALAWMLVRGGGVAIDPVPLLRALALQLVLPFVLGQAVRLTVAEWVSEWRTGLCEAGSLLVFFIIYAAVCNFFVGQAAAGTDTAWGWTVGATLALLVLGKVLCWAALAGTGWAHDLRVAAFYAASQKTLAAGLPMAGAVVAAAGVQEGLPPLAVLALPLLVFHIGQLLLGALLIPVLARR